MKHNFYPLALVSFCALLAFGSCSKDEITTAQENQITLNGHKLNISIQEEAFEAEKPVSRNTQPAKTDTVDLGNGLYAEVSVEPDTEVPAPAKTRAAMSDGHYTIYAVDASNNRLPDELSGTVSAGRFFPDHNQNIDLTPGTYTFVCFNDAVEDKGNGLDIKNAVENPMIGVTTENISGEHYKLSFTMKHWAARVRYEVTTYTAYPANLAAEFSGNTSTFGTSHFDVKGNYTHRETGAISSTTVNINKAGNEAFSPIKKAFLSKSDYSYVSLGITGGSWKANIDGTVHGKSIHKQVSKNDNLQTNHSYLIKLNLKTKQPLYLYQDGTVGYIGDKTAERQPIALVVTEKTATEKGMAMALKSNGTGVTGTDYYEYLIRGTSENFDDMHGYDYIWTTNYYASPSAFAAFSKTVPTFPPGDGFGPTYYAAGHYAPDVTVTGANVGKWFLPSAGQWKKTLMKFGNLVMPNSYSLSYPKGGQIPWSSSELVTTFTNAGATLPFDKPYAVSGTINGNGVPVFLYLSASGIAWGWDMYCNSIIGYVLPFVHF